MQLGWGYQAWTKITPGQFTNGVMLCRRVPERILFCGWRRDMHDMIAVLDAFVYPGSELWLYNEASKSSPCTIPEHSHTERSLGWRAHLFRVMTRGNLCTAYKQSCMPHRFCSARALASGQLFTALRGAA